MTKSMAVIIDYQNVPLTAANLFMPGQPVVDVTLRPLKYSWEHVNGSRRPVRSSRREKGIDVMCALTLVRLARSQHYDVVVLASRDTDLAPALDEAVQLGEAKVEAAKWFDPSAPYTRGNIKTSQKVWTTSMKREHFEASLDLHSYT